MGRPGLYRHFLPSTMGRPGKPPTGAEHEAVARALQRVITPISKWAGGSSPAEYAALRKLRNTSHVRRRQARLKAFKPLTKRVAALEQELAELWRMYNSQQELIAAFARVGYI